MKISRRDFLGQAAVTGISLSASSALGSDIRPALHSPFRVSVINDEISQDFGRACEVAAREFGMLWIELRGMWNKNIVSLDSKEVAEAQRILKKYELRVTDIASPLFKTAWKDDPRPGETTCGFSRQLYIRSAGRSARPRYRNGESFSDRSNPLLRFL